MGGGTSTNLVHPSSDEFLTPDPDIPQVCPIHQLMVAWAHLTPYTDHQDFSSISQNGSPDRGGSRLQVKYFHSHCVISLVHSGEVNCHPVPASTSSSPHSLTYPFVSSPWSLALQSCMLPARNFLGAKSLSPSPICHSFTGYDQYSCGADCKSD